MPTAHQFVVEKAHHGIRLDVFLATTGVVSRRKARALLDSGAVYVNRRRVKIASKCVFAGNQVTFYVSEESSKADPAPVTTLYQDDALIVVDKPSGVPVQATRESDRDALVRAVKQTLPPQSETPRVVHRLDRPASGAVVFALSKSAAASLSQQMAEHTTGRIYLAVVEGRCPESATLRHFLTSLPDRSAGREGHAAGTVPTRQTDLSRQRDPGRQRDPAQQTGPARVGVRCAEGSPEPGERIAISHIRRLAETPAMTLVAAALETGRTHQLRAQLAFEGTPIVGDRRYGASAPEPGAPFQRLALHAVCLSLVHPTTSQRLTFSAPLPEDFRRFLEANQIAAPEQVFLQEMLNFTQEAHHGENQHDA